MSYDVIPSTFRATIITALREHAVQSGTEIDALIADLEAGEFSTNHISVVVGRLDQGDDDSLRFVDNSKSDPTTEFLSDLLHRELDEDEADAMTNNDEAYVDCTDLTYYLETILGGSKLVNPNA